MNTNTNQNNFRMMRMRQLTEYLALSKAYIYQKISEGTFPEGHVLSPGIRAWEKSDVDSWIDQRIGSTGK
jgi:predicted DNA-binding transcriptional regulator AlpA